MLVYTIFEAQLLALEFYPSGNLLPRHILLKLK